MIRHGGMDMLFKKKMKKCDELERILSSLRMNLANNYKDNTQADYREFTAKLEKLEAAGELDGKQAEYYKNLAEEYGSQLKNYTHAKQKSTWTREDMRI